MRGPFFVAYDEITEELVAFRYDPLNAAYIQIWTIGSTVTRQPDHYVQYVTDRTYEWTFNQVQIALDPYGYSHVLQHATECTFFECFILDGGVWDTTHIQDVLPKIAELAVFEI
jgi:hypothetical protein